MNNENQFRVIEDHRDEWIVLSETGQILSGRLSGRFLKEQITDRPLVGDWVTGRLQPGDWLYIEAVVPRRSCLQRAAEGSEGFQKLAANVDGVLITCSLNEDFNLNRIERYMHMVLHSGVRPFLLLTKADLCPDLEEKQNQVRSRWPRLEFECVSVLQPESFLRLLNQMQPDETWALMGSSGVGKSSVVNFLLQESKQATKEIREFDDRGRHTTSGRSLHLLKNGVWLMDTPGLRSLSFTQENPEAMEGVFAEIETRALSCRFSDCQHESEPGCALQQALQDDELSEQQFENYQKFLAEQNFVLRKTNKEKASQQKKLWKSRSREARQIRKKKREYL